MIYKVDINVADVRIKPEFRSERVTQALFNERVEKLDEEGEYSRILQGDGYTGWIYTKFISDSSKLPEDNQYIVKENFAGAFDSPDCGLPHITMIPYGSAINGDLRDGFLKIESKRYGDLYIREGDLMSRETFLKRKPRFLEEFMVEAKKFHGAPYLWGGRSFFGIDCSGFVQAIAGSFGYQLPRDSIDQRKIGREIKKTDIQAGDLLFFPGHVTLAIGNTRFIHSSLSNGGVAYNSFDRKDSDYSEYLDSSFICARRIVDA